jgi:ribosomal protein S12 methylthiotransferase
VAADAPLARAPAGRALPRHPRPARRDERPARDAPRRVRRPGHQVRATLDRLLEEVPGITLRTTLLVGFPGETEADVEELCAFVERYRIGRLGAFTYSPEEGTSGFELESTVTEKVAKRRHRDVLRARDAVLRATQAELVGRELEVLVDAAGTSKSPAVARTAMDAPEVDLVAYVHGARPAAGSRLRVVVEGLDAESNLVTRAVGR